MGINYSRLLCLCTAAFVTFALVGCSSSSSDVQLAAAMADQSDMGQTMGTESDGRRYRYGRSFPRYSDSADAANVPDLGGSPSAESLQDLSNFEAEAPDISRSFYNRQVTLRSKACARVVRQTDLIWLGTATSTEFASSASYPTSCSVRIHGDPRSARWRNNRYGMTQRGVIPAASLPQRPGPIPAPPNSSSTSPTAFSMHKDSLRPERSSKAWRSLMDQRAIRRVARPAGFNARECVPQSFPSWITLFERD